MSWAAVETTARAAAETLRDDVQNLRWALANSDTPRDSHCEYQVLIEATVPMEIGANLHAEPFPDQVEGRVQFDLYAKAGASHIDTLEDADTIRTAMRGLRVGSLHFLTPEGPRFLGRQNGWFRWVVDCPFRAQEA